MKKKVFKKRSQSAKRFGAKKVFKRKRSVSTGAVKRVFKRKRFVKKSSALQATSSSIGAGQSSENYLGSRHTAGKAVYPAWFKTLVRSALPVLNQGAYDGSLSVGIQARESFFFWKCLGMQEIQALLSEINVTGNSATGGNDVMRAYISDVKREHQWRNSLSSTCECELYECQPRRDLPFCADVAAAVVLTPTFAPPVTSGHATGGFVKAPTGWQQNFADETKATGAVNKIAYNDVSVTPYMNHTLTSTFKVKPVKVRWPNGQFGHKGMLEAGQTLKLTCSRRKPQLWTYAKLLLDASAAFTVSDAWQCLRETPLLLMMVRGTASHDTTTKTLVGFGGANLDYVCNVTFRAWAITQTYQLSNTYTTSNATVSVAEQIAPAAAAEVGETLL